ncbi:hypothetical protein [Marinicellulosiphila megalodicopiae]|uniref:hypothetical protein n=1 Tax=Marinicellulosiphila megalodicopiae TaxID=2724896 RepID=UPI003BAE55E4
MISLNNARNFSNYAYQKATHGLWSKEAEQTDELSTEQENTEQVDEITPEQLALLSTQAHAWMVIISDSKLSKKALLHYGIDINKIMNITRKQLTAQRIQLLSKQNISFVIMVQKNTQPTLPEPFYTQLTYRCEEQNLRLLSLTQSTKPKEWVPEQLVIGLEFETVVA